jgi:hypothetical protein
MILLNLLHKITIEFNELYFRYVSKILLLAFAG